MSNENINNEARIGLSLLNAGFDGRCKYLQQQIKDAQAEVATWPDSVHRYTQLPDYLLPSNR